MVEINALIVKLETGFRLQIVIYHAYSDYCTFLKGEMYGKLPNRKVRAGHGISNNRRRVANPWWSDALTLLCNNVCCPEKVWLNCKASIERCRNHFDQAVQRAIR